MDNENSKTLTAEQEMQLRKPIEDYAVSYTHLTLPTIA